MRRFVLTTVAALLIAVSAAGTIASGAHAAQLEVRLAAVPPAIAGQSNVLNATVTDGGLPASDISVTFYSTETFAGVTGDAEIGRAVTDGRGVASITYKPHDAGLRNIRADATSKDGTVAKAMATITIEGSPEQQYVQTAGIKVPGLNARLIMGVLAIVWGILLFVAVTVIRIAAAGRADGSTETGRAGRGGA